MGIKVNLALFYSKQLNHFSCLTTLHTNSTHHSSRSQKKSICIQKPFESLIDCHTAKITANSMILGTIETVGKKFFYVEVGSKSSGILPLSELSISARKEKETLAVGHTDEFMVLTVNPYNFQPSVSLKAIEAKKAWKTAEKLAQGSQIVSATVYHVVKGGYRVDIDGFKSFLPGSLVHHTNLSEPLVGRTIPVKLIEVSEKKNRSVCSNRKAITDSEESQDLYGSLKVGDIVEGSIQNITNYGAFVDLSGAVGLIHISQISKEKIPSMQGLFEIGEKIKCMVISISAEKKRLSLSTKKLEQKPGDMLRNRSDLMSMADSVATIMRASI